MHLTLHCLWRRLAFGQVGCILISNILYFLAMTGLAWEYFKDNFDNFIKEFEKEVLPILVCKGKVLFTNGATQCYLF